MDLNLRGKLALVTGASKGIGLACARQLAEEGCHLHLASRTKVDLERASETIQARHNVSVTIHAVDLSDGDAARSLASACNDIDILVNNAGAIPAGDLQAIDEARWRDAWNLKVFGYINLCRAVYPVMKARGGALQRRPVEQSTAAGPPCGASTARALDNETPRDEYCRTRSAREEIMS